jgi:hypothetical protein
MSSLSLSRRSRVTLAAAAAASTAAVFGATGAGPVGTFNSAALLRHQPVPFVHNHAEGGYEGLTSASQEAYDNRAYPRQYISPSQENRARKAFTQLSADNGNGGKSGGGGTTGPGSGSGSSTGTSGWSLLGPTTTHDENPLLAYGGLPQTLSGRALALLVLPGCDSTQCDLFVGTAGGGVWHTANALGDQGTQAWQAVNQGLTSNAVDVLQYAHGLVYAGTGEPDGSNDSEAGRGLFSLDPTNLAAGWSQVGSAGVANDRALSGLWVDPTDASHIVIGTSAARHGASAVWGGRAFPPDAAALGAYETTDGGTNWTAVPNLTFEVNAFLGGVTNIQRDPNSDDLYASATGYGLYRIHNGTSTLVFKSASYQDSAAGIGGGRVEFSLVDNGDGTTTAYLGDSDTRGNSWVYKSTDVSTVAGNNDWTTLSSSHPTDPGYAVYGYCETQCGYDDFIVADPQNPNDVYVGGSMHYGELGVNYAGQNTPSDGRAVLHSTDGGATWTDVTQDDTIQNSVHTALHPDQHTLAYGPDGTVFETSDGGVVRMDGSADRSGECTDQNNPDRAGLTPTQVANCEQWLSSVPQKITSLNDGLATIQFQSVSTDPAGDLLGGTQDNGTLSYVAGSSLASWVQAIFGDGGQSGFDAGNSAIRYHNYYDATPDVNFHGSQVSGWDWIGDPLQKENPSFYIPFIADPTRAGYAWAGLQHIWRTTDNGGSQAFLDAHCNEFNYHPVRQACGDWVATGGGGSGGQYYQGSAGDAGDLTGVYFGQSRKGEFVTQITRAKDSSTMWAGTRTGRVFITKNADAAGSQNVRYTRIDTPSTPGRFVSGIAVDPNDPNHAFVSYSGYSAYAAGGHVYEVRYHPATGKADWTDLSYDLGDIPITSIALGPTGDLYAGTDFGVAHLNAGAGSWNKETDLPIVSVFSLIESPNGSTLYAATHGRGAYQLAL